MLQTCSADNKDQRCTYFTKQKGKETPAVIIVDWDGIGTNEV